MGAGARKTYEFYNVSMGKLVQSIKKEDGTGWLKKPWQHYTGFLRWISIKDDTYQNRPTKKLELVMLDSDNTDQEAIITSTLKTWFVIGFFQRIGSVDLKRAFTVGTGESKQQAKVTFCWMHQDGSEIPMDESYPRPITIDAETKDYRAVIERIEADIKNIQKALVSIYGAPYRITRATASEDNHPGVGMPVRSEPKTVQSQPEVPLPGDDDLPL